MTIEQMLGIAKSAAANIYSVEEVTSEPPVSALDRYIKGDSSASSELLKELQPTIDKAINSFGGADPGLKTRARIMALDAAKSFDASKGTKLSTHVYGTLQKLIRETGRRGNLTHIPENVAILRSRIKEAIDDWKAEYDEEPTVEQLADKTGISIKRIDAVMNYKTVTPDSLTASPEGDLLAADRSTKAAELYNRVVYDELDDTDKKIYEWSTGYGKGVKLSGIEIARRLKITPAAVSKRSVNISKKFADGQRIISMVTNNAV